MDPHTKFEARPPEPVQLRLRLDVIIYMLMFIAGVVFFKLMGPHFNLELGYEYYITSPADGAFDLELRSLGKNGWDLVSSRRATSSEDGVVYEMIFKRPRSIWGMLQ